VVCLLIEGLHALRSVETPVFWVLESGGGRPRSLLPTRPTAALTCRNRPTLAPRAINPSYQGCRCHATPAQRQQDAALLHKRRPLRGPVDHSETEANDCACLYDSRGGACPALCRPCPRVFPDPFHAWSTPGRDLDVPTIIAGSTPPETVFSVPGHGGDNLLVALVLDVPEPDLTPVENLLTPTILDVLAQAAAADQPYSWAADHISTRSITFARRSTSTPGRR
jgi:hypothetical protein